MPKTRPLICLCIFVLAVLGVGRRSTRAEALPLERLSDFSGDWTQTVELPAGQVVEFSVGFPSPSQLPENGRVLIEWKAPDAESSWRKVLHALDPDAYLVYQAPRSGKYTLTLRAVEEEESASASSRWRENGA